MATWDLSETKHHLLICNGSSCNKAGAEELTQSVRNEVANLGLDEKIHTTRTKCNGRCQDRCVLIVYPEGIWYKDLKPEDANQLIASLITDDSLFEKVSHRFNGESFIRQPEVPIGECKGRERVKKVSKVF
ncbi:ferredoxin [Alkalihalophilus pseudofirmus]|nr:ferredoxin [Alkalihalophilus pseudofirmus]